MAMLCLLNQIRGLALRGLTEAGHQPQQETGSARRRRKWRIARVMRDRPSIIDPLMPQRRYEGGSGRVFRNSRPALYQHEAA